MPWCPWKGDRDDFLMDLAGWRSLRIRFLRILRLAESRGESARKELSEKITAEAQIDFDAGSFRIGLHWRTATHRVNAGFESQVIPSSLYGAFLAMLWLDVADRNVNLRRCQAPECGLYFDTRDARKVYCSHECGVRVARRNWWGLHGNEWRKKRSKNGVKVMAQPKEQPLCSVAGCPVRASETRTETDAEKLREDLGGLELRDVQPGKLCWPLCEEHQKLRPGKTEAGTDSARPEDHEADPK
jgi:hypothetical protein